MAAEQHELWPAQVYDAYLKQRKLPLTLGIIVGEAFSSWFIRLADAHAMSVQQLGFWLMGRGRQVFGEDVDRGAWSQLMAMVSASAGQPLPSLLDGTLLRYQGVLWGQLPRQGTARWVLPVVKRGTLRNGYGGQYCPMCLAADSVPHLRLVWRLAFSVACSKHCCILLDRCDRCGDPLAPHRWRTGIHREIGSSGIVRCQNCGADRRHSRFEEAEPGVLAAQARMVAALERGYAIVGGQPLHGLPFFAGAAMVWSLLDDPRPARTVWGELELDVPAFVKNTNDRYGSFERRNVVQRVQLLRAFEQILSRGVDNFVCGLANRMVSSRTLLRYSTSLQAPAPFWYSRIVREHLDRTSYTPSDGELDAAIRYKLRSEVVRPVRVSEVCQLLGMATRSNKRVWLRIRKLGDSRS